MENNERNSEQEPNKIDNRSHGPQGIDKAPGEEPSGDNVQFTQQTQKGKQSVDGDPEREEDRALGEQDV
ncbi:MAG: hypothetical protein EOO15_03370 [Chitinophagaceae bacterium]|nr:MAG: hypothetical protein EOO15_03370 [Chitinophagaceae bacterium]